MENFLVENPAPAVENFLADNPALVMPEWLPEGVWPDLDELRDEHRRRLAARRGVGADLSALRRRFEAEDEARAEALKEGFSKERAPKLPKKLTPPEKRRALLNEAEAKSKAAGATLTDFLREAIDKIKAHAEEWDVDLVGRAHEAENKRREAQRLLAEAEAAEAATLGMRRWLERTVADRTGRHIPASQLTSPNPITEEANDQ